MRLLRTYMKKNQVKLCPKRLVCTFVNQSKVVRTFQMPQTLQVCGSRFSRSKVKTKKTKGVWYFLSCLGTATRFLRSASFISSPKKRSKNWEIYVKHLRLRTMRYPSYFFITIRISLNQWFLKKNGSYTRRFRKKDVFVDLIATTNIPQGVEPLCRLAKALNYPEKFTV